MKLYDSCPLCDCRNLVKIYKKNNICASAGLLCNKKNENKFGHAALNLVQCLKCGFIFNAAFDLDKIQECYEAEEYKVKKNISPSMVRMHNNLIELLSKIKGDIFFEIGSGQGEIAASLSKNFKNVYTWDPAVSYPLEKINEIHPNWIHANKFFTKLPESFPKADLIVARHLLEHLDNPASFLEIVFNSISDNGYLYLEVPNSANSCKNLRFIDFFHDHFGYYFPETLQNYLNNNGFIIYEQINFYDDQIFGLLCKKNINIYSVLPSNTSPISSNFSSSLNSYIGSINEKISQYNNIAIYGAGAQANSLLNYINCINNIKYCLDINQDKHGKYLYNSNIPIIDLNSDILNSISLIIISATLHEKEIIKTLANLDFKGEIMSINQGLHII